jgi:Cof subfamily protein (haloacid dehalogenase superfamily)
MTTEELKPDRVYISDLDGTLLQDDACLSAYSREALNDLLAQGLRFTVASARSVVSIHQMLAGLKLELPVVEMNGAFLSDLATCRHLKIHSIERAAAETAYGLITGCGYLPFISTFNGQEDCLYHGEIRNEGMAWYLGDRRKSRDSRLRDIDRLPDALREQVICLNTIGRQAELIELEARIKEQLDGSLVTLLMENKYSPGWYWLTLHSPRATKDQAIRGLIADYGLGELELVVFGDNYNDIPMFQMADRAYAVENASASLKPLATAIIGPNSEDSVAGFLQHDWRDR